MRLVKPSGEAERATQTTLDTIEITRKLVTTWKSPPFQRDVRVNAGVTALVAELQRDNVLPGTITLGVLDGQVYIVDGQHQQLRLIRLCGLQQLQPRRITVINLAAATP